MRFGAGMAGMAVLMALGLSGCGPVPVEQAERSCLRDAELAQAPRTNVAVGVGAARGDIRPYASIRMDVSSDYIRGRDPADAYNRCVMNRSGQMPRRPLHDQPGWRG